MTRGFALLAVLWVLALLAVGLATAFSVLDLERRAAHNRLLLTRAGWAAESCVAVATERLLVDSSSSADTIDLGRGARCTWQFADPNRLLDVNNSDRVVLTRLFLAHGVGDSVAAALAERLVARARVVPFEDSLQLEEFGVPSRARAHLTTDATDGISIGAPAEVLEAAGLSRAAVIEVLSQRVARTPIRAIAELSERVPSGIGEDRDLAGSLRFGADRWLLIADGWIAGDAVSPHSGIELLVRVADRRLAVLRRRVW